MQNNKHFSGWGQMTMGISFFIFALFPSQTHAQTDKPVQRKDSVTVYAGIPKEQLALESQLDLIVSKGDQLLRSGNASDAIAQYQNALALVQRQALLSERERWVQAKLAAGYVRANQPRDAIPIYTKLLDAKKEDCGAQTAAVANCADAELDLAVARMHATDFSPALVLLEDADSKYAQAERLSSDSHEYAMIQLKNQGQTKLLIAVTLVRTEKTPQAITTVESAISELTRVQSDEAVTVGIRDDAARSLQEARTILSRLKSTQ